MPLSDYELFPLLFALDLPAADFVIAGSAPLLIKGLRDHIDDIDVVARGLAWARAKQLGKVKRAPFGNVDEVRLQSGRVEVLDGWFPHWRSVDELIDSAEVIEGINFVPLAITLEWKRLLMREKDIADIARLELAVGSEQ